MKTRLIKLFLDNLTIIFSLVFMGFLILDYFNAKMNFVSNSFSRKLLLIFCILSMINSIWQMIMNGRNS